MLTTYLVFFDYIEIRCNRDPCYDDPCGPNANCEKRNDAAVCTCPPGRNHD